VKITLSKKPIDIIGGIRAVSGVDDAVIPGLSS
jgi:hypothetical protein